MTPPEPEPDILEQLRAGLKLESLAVKISNPLLVEAAKEALNEIERLKADHLSALKLSHEWMAKHDCLLGFIQARPEMLKELIAEEPKP